MNRPSVYYFAHPVGPPCACEGKYPGHATDPAGEVACNLARAKRWMPWCRDMAPHVSIIAPWMVDVELGDDTDPARRERGLRDNCAVVKRCDGIILAGGKLSPGMSRELEAFTRSRGLMLFDPVPDRVIDLRKLGDEPPGTHYPDLDNAAVDAAIRLRALR